MKEIMVKIDINNYIEAEQMSPNVWEGRVIQKLKNAGIPIKGILLYRGLESGTLHRLDDPTDGSLSYVWCPNHGGRRLVDEKRAHK